MEMQRASQTRQDVIKIMQEWLVSERELSVRLSSFLKADVKPALEKLRSMERVWVCDFEFSATDLGGHAQDSEKTWGQLCEVREYECLLMLRCGRKN
eukprot:1157823-Amphidinium_carterae.2